MRFDRRYLVALVPLFLAFLVADSIGERVGVSAFDVIACFALVLATAAYLEATGG